MEGDTPAVTRLLRDILSLSMADQQRIYEALKQVWQSDDDARAGGNSMPERLPPASPEPGEEVDVDEWIGSIANEPAWTRVQLLSQEIQAAGDDQVRKALEAAQSAIFQQHPELAIRHAVVRVASEHPIATLTGLLGLGLAFFGLFRLVFRAMF